MGRLVKPEDLTRGRDSLNIEIINLNEKKQRAMKQPNGLRFESREIAVILSLFIFVSLLMFTVGIVIGKGLAQAKFEGEYQSALPTKETSPRSPSSQTQASQTPASQTQTSSSVSINSPFAEEEMKSEEMKPREDYKPLELQPKTKESLAIREDWENKETDLETESLLNNPMIRDLFEEKKPAVAQKKSNKKQNRDFAIERDFSQLQGERSTASISVPPPSSASGPYSVQIAAYSDKTQAEERVEALKKIGYPHAYFSSVHLGENKETWFRVWLGYYPSFESAKLGGTSLQARGEVKNFLVRKTQKTGSTD